MNHFFNAPPGDTINFRTIPEFFIGANGAGAIGTTGQAVPGGLNGTLMDCTAGVNCYWNPYTKMVFNYVHAIADSPTLPQSQADMFGVRAKVDF